MAIKEGFISNILRMSKHISIKFEQTSKTRACMKRFNHICVALYHK